MTSSNPFVVKQAVAHFKSGHYQQAKTCYEQAAKYYGQNLFANSIRLCEMRIKGPVTASPLNSADNSAELKTPKVSAAQQLTETQKLLEHYYTRCQELQSQLLDRT